MWDSTEIHDGEIIIACTKTIPCKTSTEIHDDEITEACTNLIETLNLIAWWTYCWNEYKCIFSRDQGVVNVVLK